MTELKRVFEKLQTNENSVLFTEEAINDKLRKKF